MKNLFGTTKKTLVILSGVVWYIGALMLFRGGLELLFQALELRPGSSWHWLFIGLGILLGVVQARTIFTRSCRKNIQRIRELEDPRLWQFRRVITQCDCNGVFGTNRSLGWRGAVLRSQDRRSGYGLQHLQGR